MSGRFVGRVGGRVVVVSPVYGNAATLPALAERVLALDPTVVLRLVVDASPDDSAQVARGLAAAEPRVRVTVLTANVGQHRALARGLADEPVADAWVCLDADLQDPPEAVPALLARLASPTETPAGTSSATWSGTSSGTSPGTPVEDLTGPAVHAVFAGRRGGYQARGRRLTGEVHRRAVRALSGLPVDAGAFVAMDRTGRAAVLDGLHHRGAPSVVVALAGLPVASVPVTRQARTVGASAWSSRARAGQSLATMRWLLRRRLSGSTAARAGRS